MKTINRNIELPVDRLYPHPDNPRKDVGYSVSDEENKLLSGTHEEYQHV